MSQQVDSGPLINFADNLILQGAQQIPLPGIVPVRKQADSNILKILHPPHLPPPPPPQKWNISDKNSDIVYMSDQTYIVGIR